MARYPTFDEYRTKPAKGIAKCDELLRRLPKDVQLLTVKFELLMHVGEDAEAKAIIDQLLATQPPPNDLSDLAMIEEAVTEQIQADAYPQPLTSGQQMNKLWDNAFKTSNNTNYKLDLQSLRFSQAIFDNRLQDAQQSLIQLKALQPKNRAFYMAHAAVTQLLSASKDDLSSRLALSLARKAVSEKFDEDKSLDCRVPGQIFALQDSEKDLGAIKGRSFATSKQVHDAAKRTGSPQANGEAATAASEESSTAKIGSPDWLDGRIVTLKSQFVALSDAADESKLYSLAATSAETYRTAVASMDQFRYRHVCTFIFIAISALIWIWESNGNVSTLLQAAFLAEELLRNNQHVHEARVILIHLYMRLDLAASALRHWDALRVKEIQFDTIGHAFLTRLSVMHPHKITTVATKSNDPATITKNGLAVYHRCEQKLAETEAKVLSNGQTGMIFDLHELRENLRLSLTRRILSLEQRRSARWSGQPLDMNAIGVTPRLTAQWLDVKDNRDFAAAFNYGYNVERTLHGHDDTRLWLLYSLVADTAWCLCNDAVPPVKDVAALLEQLPSSSPDETSNLTAVEIRCGKIVHQVLSQLNTTSPPPTEAIQSLTDSVSALSTITSGNNPLNLSLKAYYTHLDTIRIAHAFSLHTQNPSATSSLQVLQSKTSEAFTALQNQAKQASSRLQTSHITSALKTSPELAAQIQAFGSDEIEWFGSSVVEAAKSGWAGVGKVKLEAGSASTGVLSVGRSK